MAYTTTMLAWVVVQDGRQLGQAGQLLHALDAVKWGTDYFLKAHTAPDELYVQVREGPGSVVPGDPSFFPPVKRRTMHLHPPFQRTALCFSSWTVVSTTRAFIGLQCNVLHFCINLGLLEPPLAPVQVGEVSADHSCWMRPEDMTTPRTLYKVGGTKCGSDVAGQTAAALAAASIAFRTVDPAYSATLLAHARQLHSFATKCLGKYSDVVQNVNPYYTSYSGYAVSALPPTFSAPCYLSGTAEYTDSSCCLASSLRAPLPMQTVRTNTGDRQHKEQNAGTKGWRSL